MSGGSSIYPSQVDIKYSILEHNLKNNTRYICTLTAYIDYGTKEEQNNERNVFSFPFYVDFEAPIVTDVTYRTEYDKTEKKMHLYADLSIYDNHYAMGVSLGQITKAEEGSEYTFSLSSFGKYIIPVYSSFNSTSIVSVELTEYVSQLKKSCSISFNDDGTSNVVENTNTFVANVYDYAMNYATYEISLPDEIAYMYFSEDTVNLSLNETLNLTSVLNVYPTTSWIETLDFTSSNTNVVSIVNNTLIAKESGLSTITATGKDENGNIVTASMTAKVLSPGDDGYVDGYSIPEINKFAITGYKTIKAFYNTDNTEREIGVDGGEYDFGDTISLSMFPSESVKLMYTLDSYFPEKTSVEFKSSNTKIATINENGEIIAQAKGTTTVMISVLFDGRSTFYSAKVSITVKDPYNFMSIYLYNYKGLGGVVEIPGDRGITTIYSYAFSNYEFVPKDLEAGDVVDDEDPYLIKQHYIGDNTITKVIIPEGVTTINEYAFANLTALEEVVLPSTLTRIGVGAFYNCTKLKTINLENAKFINEKAFYNCPIEEVDLSSAVSIGNYAFENCKLNYIVLPSCAQSLSEGAFYNNEYLTSVTLKAKKIKIAPYAFAKCSRLTAININASVISAHAFEDCTELSDVTIGQDVAIIGEYAFSNTAVSAFKLNSKNPYLTLEEGGALILKGTELILAAPGYIGSSNTITSNAESIASGAFAGNKKIFYLVLNNVKNIGDYAFANCVNLRMVNMPNVETIGNYAFFGADLTDIGDLYHLKSIGNYAFASNEIEDLVIYENATIGSYAFANNHYLKNITLYDNVKVGSYAFFNPITLYTYEATQNFDHYTPYVYYVRDKDGNIIKTNSYYSYNFIDGVVSTLEHVTCSNNVTIGEGAFFGNGKLNTVVFNGEVEIGDYAFYSCEALSNITNFNNIKSIGNYAFSGYTTYDFFLENNIWRMAYESEYDEGVYIATSYKMSCFAPTFTSADLSNVEYVGVGAFSGNTNLSSVILSDSMNKVGKEMFANCKSLTNIVLKDNITIIEDFAFASSGLETINLNNIEKIGEGAFNNTKVNNLTFKDNVEIGDRAFYYSQKLDTIANANNIKSVGAYAFALTSITNINLENVARIGDFAFSNSSLTKVSFGDKLVEIGENPFYGCDITTFGKESDVIFDGRVVGQTVLETYDISDYVKVIDGVIYEVIPTGLELVSYPKLKSDKEFTIDDNTRRISAAAFADSNIEKVVLSTMLLSIGDKAFYGCDKLSLVVFNSFDAPLLEEEYNPSYLLYTNLPISGKMGEFEGLGISKYYMWNLTSNYTNFYFGANFKDYIGHETGDLIMVRPRNGKNYDSFIFDQYFSSVIDGVFAPTMDTLNVIDLISALPTNITLNDEDVIVKARNAYNSITSEEQRALVSNYEELVKAESTLAYLKSRNHRKGSCKGPHKRSR